MAILIVGLGALGSVSSDLLSRSGHDLVLQDYDIVQQDNVGRTLYGEDDVGLHKVDAARRRLHGTITVRKGPFDGDLAGIDLIVDGTDNLPARLQMNDAARRADIPLVIAAGSGTRGLVFPVLGSPCWRCIVGKKMSQDDCSTDISRAIVDAIVTLQVEIAKEIISGSRPSGLHVVDARGVRRIGVRPDSECETCRGTAREEPFTFSFCSGSRKMQARPGRPRKLDLSPLPAVKEYGSAVLVRLGEGTALVHEHGLIEFSGVPDEQARRFARELLHA